MMLVGMEAPMEQVRMDEIKNKDLLQTIQDFVDSDAVEMLVTKVADDNWTIIATVPKTG